MLFEDKLVDTGTKGLSSHFHPMVNCSQIFILHELGSGELSDNLDLGVFIEVVEFLSCAVGVGFHGTETGSPWPCSCGMLLNLLRPDFFISINKMSE